MSLTSDVLANSTHTLCALVFPSVLWVVTLASRVVLRLSGIMLQSAYLPQGAPQGMVIASSAQPLSMGLAKHVSPPCYGRVS